MALDLHEAVKRRPRDCLGFFWFFFQKYENGKRQCDYIFCFNINSVIGKT